MVGVSSRDMSTLTRSEEGPPHEVPPAPRLELPDQNLEPDRDCDRSRDASRPPQGLALNPDLEQERPTPGPRCACGAEPVRTCSSAGLAIKQPRRGTSARAGPDIIGTLTGTGPDADLDREWPRRRSRADPMRAFSCAGACSTARPRRGPDDVGTGPCGGLCSGLVDVGASARGGLRWCAGWGGLFRWSAGLGLVPIEVQGRCQTRSGLVPLEAPALPL